MTEDKRIEESVNKVLEYCSVELCLSASEVVTVLEGALKEADNVNHEKQWSEGQ